MEQPKKSVCPLCKGTGQLSFCSKDMMYGGEKTYTYHECDNCGAIYQFPMSTLEEIAGFYPDNYKVYSDNLKLKPKRKIERAVLNTRYGYHHLSSSLFSKLLAPIVSLFKYRNSLPYEGGGKLLDIGCANGRFMLNMRDLGWHVQGVEFNEIAVSICRQQHLEVHHGDLASANLAENSFDLITARQVIEHVPDPNAFISDIARILKPGGRLHLRTPNSKALGRQFFNQYWFPNEVPRHLVLFTKENLEMLARKHGLVPVDTRIIVRTKFILRSLDYKYDFSDKPASKRKLLRILVKLYKPFASLSGRGDELFTVYRKS